MRALYFVFAAILTSGCTSVPKQVLTTDLPPGLTKQEIQYSMLAATGVNAPMPETLTINQKMGDHALSMIPFYRSVENQDTNEWRFETMGPSYVYASYVNGEELLRARMDFSTRQIRYSIAGSQYLNESGNKIHRIALTWLGQLQTSVNREIGKTQFIKQQQTANK